MQQLCSHFIENNLIDYCFKEFDLEDKNSDGPATQAHLGIRNKDFARNLSFEYIISEVVSHEKEFQKQKSKLLKQLVSLIPHIQNFKNLKKITSLIEMYIKENANLDLSGFELLNDNIEELCNNKLNRNEITIRSVKKEFHNIILTVFDGYKLEAARYKKLSELVKVIRKDQKKARKVIEKIKEKKNPRKGKRDGFKIYDGVGVILELLEAVRDSADHIVENYLDLEGIDRASLADFHIEENQNIFYKTVVVKYLKESSGASQFFGRGIKESTRIHCLRIYLSNMLTRRKKFIKTNLKILFIKEINSLYEKLDFELDLAQQLQTNKRKSNNLPKLGREDQLMEQLRAFERIEKITFDEKAEGRIKNGLDPWEIIRGTYSYKNNELKHRVQILNLLHFYKFSTDNLNKVKILLNNLAGLLELRELQKIGYKNSGKKIFFKGNFIKEILSFKEKEQQLADMLSFSDFSSIRIASLERILSLDPIELTDFTKIRKNLLLLSDTFSFIQVFHSLDNLLRSSTIQFNFMSSKLASELLEDTEKVLTNQTVSEKVINHHNVVFEEKTHKKDLFFRSDLYLTATGDRFPSRVILGSKNESIMRRLVLQGLKEKISELYSDPLLKIKEIVAAVLEEHRQAMPAGKG